MAFQSARQSLIVRKGNIETLSFGDQSNPILFYLSPDSATIYLTINTGTDPEVDGPDVLGNTTRLTPGEYKVFGGGGAGAYDIRLGVTSTELRGGRVQICELGAAATVAPSGASVGNRNILDVGKLGAQIDTDILGTGASPLLVKNVGPTGVFLTINSGTDPDNNEVSSDANTFQLHEDDYVVVGAIGTPYEVRAQTAPSDTKRGSLLLLELV